MTKEQVLERIKELEASREQLRATLVAHEGALQDCQWWLKKFEETAEKKK